MRKYKRYGSLLALSLLAAIPVGAQSIDPPTEDQFNLNLIAQINRSHLLTPSDSTVEETIVIDNAQEVKLIFGSPDKNLKIELISPSGQRFSLDDTDTETVSTEIFPDPADPETTGANYLFVLSNPEPGTWSYIIQDTTTLSKPRGVIFSLFSSSPVRAGMTSAELDNRVDRDVTLGLVVADGQNVLTNPEINATLIKVDDLAFTETSVNFHDDGTNGDATAGDGLFTASVKPGVTGEFLVFANIEGTNALGNPFQRTTSTAFNVHPDRAHFSGSFSDRGIDTDGDGLFNQIGISPAVEVLEPGEYNVQVTLKASNGEAITSNTKVNLPVGTVTPEVKFRSEEIKNFLKVNGSYVVSNALLRDGSVTMDRAFELGNTATYDIGQLQRKAIEFSDGGSATGVDTNGNGKFDFLDVSLPMNFLRGGNYNWSARIVDQNRTEVALASGNGSLSAGDDSVKLRFNGAAIGDNGVDGPYLVQDLIIYGEGKSLIVDDPLTTQSFTASQFEGFVSPDQEPPQLSVNVTPNTLSPPNHKMVEITVDTEVSDNIDPNPTVTLDSITSNEGQNVRGDGNTATDIEIQPDGRIFLRAERSGTGEGRVYTLTYSARDAAGNVTQTTAEVRVGHSKGK